MVRMDVATPTIAASPGADLRTQRMRSLRARAVLRAGEPWRQEVPEPVVGAGESARVPWGLRMGLRKARVFLVRVVRCARQELLRKFKNDIVFCYVLPCSRSSFECTIQYIQACVLCSPTLSPTEPTKHASTTGMAPTCRTLVISICPMTGRSHLPHGMHPQAPNKQARIVSTIQ